MARDIKAGTTLRFRGTVNFFHKWNIHQIEEIQQAEPGDSGQQMDPAEQHQKIGLGIVGERYGGEGEAADEKHFCETVPCHGISPGWSLYESGLTNE